VQCSRQACNEEKSWHISRPMQIDTNGAGYAVVLDTARHVESHRVVHSSSGYICVWWHTRMQQLKQMITLRRMRHGRQLYVAAGLQASNSMRQCDLWTPAVDYFIDNAPVGHRLRAAVPTRPHLGLGETVVSAPAPPPFFLRCVEQTSAACSAARRPRGMCERRTSRRKSEAVNRPGSSSNAAAAAAATLLRWAAATAASWSTVTTGLCSRPAAGMAGCNQRQGGQLGGRPLQMSQRTHPGLTSLASRQVNGLLHLPSSQTSARPGQIVGS
jgi:hypothetical protein